MDSHHNAHTQLDDEPVRTRVDWRIYYSGGETYSNHDGEPQCAPKTNVQVVVARDHNTPSGFLLVHGCDFYTWENESWYGVDIYGLNQYLFEPGWKIVLFGRAIETDVFIDLKRQAANDPDFKR